MSRIGIGVVTYNRRPYLELCIKKIQEFTSGDYTLLVADDGSTDDTVEYCKTNKIRVISGKNRGVCWNKNRALFALEALGCDPILLVEDDCFPDQVGWEFEWRVATAVHGHVSYFHPKLAPWTLAGSGTPLDPYVNNKATAQVASISGALLRKVGFFDTRFQGYGVGHAEWTTRVKRAGGGFAFATLPNGARARANLYISGGITANDAPTFKDKDNIRRNEELFEKLKSEPIYRHPWSTEAERDAFAKEMKSINIDASRYINAFCGTPEEFAVQEVMYRHAGRKAVNKILTDDRSFALRDGWINSIGNTIPVFGGEVVPWLNYSVVKLLQDRVQPDWRVFEYGAGYSTLWWSTKVAEVFATESDANWAALVRTTASKKALVKSCNDPEAFPREIDDIPGKFDVIVVDGLNRPACALHAVGRLSDRGILLYDNTDRAEYAKSRDTLRQKGFKELQLTGVAPMTIRRETTSIFYREGNCLGI